MNVDPRTSDYHEDQARESQRDSGLKPSVSSQFLDAPPPPNLTEWAEIKRKRENDAVNELLRAVHRPISRSNNELLALAIDNYRAVRLAASPAPKDESIVSATPPDPKPRGYMISGLGTDAEFENVEIVHSPGVGYDLLIDGKSVREEGYRAGLARAEAMEKALRPFARFAEAFDGQPLKGLHDEFYVIHTNTEWEASLRMSDMRAARLALSPPSSSPPAPEEREEA